MVLREWSDIEIKYSMHSLRRELYLLKLILVV